MSNYSGGYNQYSGNPYGQTGEPGYDDGNRTGGGYPQANPYSNQGAQPAGYGASDRYNDQPASNYGQSNPQYGQSTQQYGQSNQQHGQTNQGYGQQAPASQYGQGQEVAPASQPLSRDEFLQRVEATKKRINDLTSNIAEIGIAHRNSIDNPSPAATARLEALVTQTQLLNTGIKTEIKNLERDAARSNGNSIKDNQIANLKKQFQNQLKDYQRQENDYRQRYREAIARQVRIVKPLATEKEIEDAQNANWDGEGVFQTALKSNRTGQAESVLGNVRSRHNEIAQIEKTMVELAELFQQLDEQIVYQGEMVQQIEQQTDQVKTDTEAANVHLDKGIKSARRARKLKWWCTAIVVIILAIIALVLGIYFGVVVKNRNNNNSNNPPAPTSTN